MFIYILTIGIWLILTAPVKWAGVITINQMSIGQMSFEQTSIVQMPIVQMPIGQMSIGQMLIGLMSLAQKWGMGILYQYAHYNMLIVGKIWTDKMEIGKITICQMTLGQMSIVQIVMWLLCHGHGHDLPVSKSWYQYPLLRAEWCYDNWPNVNWPNGNQ